MEIKKKWTESVNKDIKEMIYILDMLDEENIRKNPAPEEWSIMQIVVHVSEAISFWLNHIEEVAIDPAIKWGSGRSFFDNDRLYAISDKNILNTTVDEAINDLKRIPILVEESLSSLTSEKLSIVASSDKPVFDGKTVKYIFKKEIINHIKGHVYQIKRNLIKLDKFL